MVEQPTRAQNRILRWQWQGGLDRSPPNDAVGWKEGLEKAEFYPVIRETKNCRGWKGPL